MQLIKKGFLPHVLKHCGFHFFPKRNPFQNVLMFILILPFCHFQSNEMIYFPSGFTTKFLYIYCVSPVIIRHNAFQVKSYILISNLNTEMFSVLNFEPIQLLFCTFAFSHSVLICFLRCNAYLEV